MVRGAAIEARILAEDPASGFLPAAGKVSYVQEPDGPGIRVDSALFQGMEVTTDYDSLIAKVIVWGEDREAAIGRLTRALKEFQVSGVPTSKELLSKIISQENFVHGNVDTTFLDNFDPRLAERTEALEKIAAIAAALAMHREKKSKKQDAAQENNWRKTAWLEQMRGTI